MKKSFLFGIAAVGFGLGNVDAAQAAGGCICRPAPAVAATPAESAAPAVAQSPTQTRRSFSVQPSAAPAAVYSRPYRARSTTTPAWLLPKSDPRKYSN